MPLVGPTRLRCARLNFQGSIGAYWIALLLFPNLDSTGTADHIVLGCHNKAGKEVTHRAVDNII